MGNKRNYSRTSVKEVCSETLRNRCLERGGSGTSVGLDIAKLEIVVVVRWPDGSFESPWSVKNPSEIGELIQLLVIMRETCTNLTIGMESTGTYGESVRSALTAANLEVHRISGKACFDYKEIFDGVASQHDGKDAGIIAELTHFGKGTPWPFELASERDQQIGHQVRRLEAFEKQATMWVGRLEGMVTKHWPEVSRLLTLRSVSLLQCLMLYGSPQRLLADEEAANNLRKWGRNGLKDVKIEAVLESARTTSGVPMSPSDIQWMQEIAQEIHKALQEVRSCQKRLEEIISQDETLQDLSSTLGTTTLSVLLATVGDPSQYSSSGAFLKALGLNLKEQSSGQHQGQLKITKRGPSLARKYLFFFTLRTLRSPSIRQWYERYQKVGNVRGRGTEHRKRKGIIGIMRKLCRSLWYTHHHGLEFDYSKVFPDRPLDKPRRSRRRRRALSQ